ncbi:protein-glutamate methylesterase/protein-glutamine glutaminase [Natranaerobius trueperi]|uniref:Protein-glutamate methylesterase/protein-glutamine glutaminase n=1 Tax=Natranaerobius trueperi TaxID=759412 RepID=A0A226C1K7_9FIRM|nr:chemotaxis response regulator protein-glutamate methylesterase [Natranaerobius trueperi]OWZ84250.1 chemotaxis response regulator protein-glutamate methylesterase [Natranaerobius trueperi]
MKSKNNIINVLVVDDSAFMRRVISDMIHNEEDLEVVKVARNGEQALEYIEKYAPDVVTLDIEMPILDGIETLKRIKFLSRPPTVIMLSSFTQKGSQETLKALELGAVDFISKPSGPISLDIKSVQNGLTDKIRAAYHAKTENTYKTANEQKLDTITDVSNKKVGGNEFVLVIGSSTGGPRALQEVIPKLPKDIPGCVLVVQHMPVGFTKLMGERLDKLSSLTVKEAQDGEPLMRGRVYIAPGDYHMSVSERTAFTDNSSLSRWQIKIDDSPPVKGLRPCVDTLFESVSKMQKVDLFGVILTGMGNDGARGVKRLKRNGAYIIVEDESSCIVFGMPKAAINTGVVDEIIPLPDIAPRILKLLI